MAEDSLRRAQRQIEQAEYESLEEQVAIHGEALKLLANVLSGIQEDIRRLQSGAPRRGVGASY